MLNKFKDKRVLILSTLIVVLGIILSALAFGSTRNELEYENSGQLLDIAKSIDFNMSRFIGYVQTDLNAVTSDSRISDGLDEYFRSGSNKKLADAVIHSEAGYFPMFDPIIISSGSEILYSTGNSSSSFYVFPDGFQTEGLCICKTKDDHYYLAFSAPIKDSAAVLTFMVELNSFYSQIAGEALTSEYWLVLYNRQCNVFLQNDLTQPSYTHKTREEALERNDGFSLMVKAEDAGEILTGAYLFKNNYGSVNIRNLMAVVPSAQSLNRYFAVGFAKDGSDIWNLILMTYGHLFSGLFLVALGFTVTAVLLLKARAENRQKQSRMSALEDENKEMQKLVDKSRELEHIQRLETIGTMTSSIAHEFNNLLTPIMGYSMLLIQKMEEEGNSENLDELFEIYTSASKAKEVIDRLSSLSRKNTGASYKILVPDELAERTLSIAKTAAPKETQIHTYFQCAEPCLEANEVQIIQVLLNLILNSFQAMGSRPGHIYLSTRHKDGKVTFRIEDTAGGIPEDVEAHIFEPFFTTKSPSTGTGLGLPIVSQIVNEHGGRIVLNNRPGKGCTFTVELPEAPETGNMELL